MWMLLRTEEQVGCSVMSCHLGKVEENLFFSFRLSLWCKVLPSHVNISYWKLPHQHKQYPQYLFCRAFHPSSWSPIHDDTSLFWIILCFIIYTIAGFAGHEHFSAILSDFLSILSYWMAFFIIIVVEEHFIFRRKTGTLGGYNLDDLDSPKQQVYPQVLLVNYNVNQAIDSLLALSLACLA